MKKLLTVVAVLVAATAFVWRKRQANQADHALWAGSTDAVE